MPSYSPKDFSELDMVGGITSHERELRLLRAQIGWTAFARRQAEGALQQPENEIKLYREAIGQTGLSPEWIAGRSLLTVLAGSSPLSIHRPSHLIIIIIKFLTVFYGNVEFYRMS